MKNTFADRKKDEDEEVIIAGLEIMKGLFIDTAGSVVEDTVVDLGVDERLYRGGDTSVNFGIDFFGLSQVREEINKNNRQINERINAINYKKTLTDVAAGGTVCQYGEEILINNRMVNERELLLRINYYNAETDSELTLEQVEQQLRNYELSDGNTEELVKFCAFVEEKGILVHGACCDFERYDYDVEVILTEMETDRFSATREQLEDACRKATEK